MSEGKQPGQETASAAEHGMNREQLLAELRLVAEERDRLRAQINLTACAPSSLELVLRAAFRAAPAGLVLLTPDPAFRMVEMSDARLKSTMTRREDTIGRPLFEVFPDSMENQGAIGRTSLRASLLHVLETKEPQRLGILRYDLVHPDGGYEERFWRPANLPLLGRHGEVLYLLHVAEDVTAEVRLETAERERKRLSNLSTATDQFLGILSHELRTPINAIMGFGSILADGVAGALNPQQAQYAQKILDRSDDLLALVDDLLDMTRVRTGKFSLDCADVDAADLIRQVVAGSAPNAAAKGLTLRDEVPATLPPVRADRRRLAQILENLLTNAIKYTEEGTITVSARVEGEALRVEVADSGIGIPRDQQHYVFEAFTQVDMSNTRQVGGVGLGLSIVKALVHAHGGDAGVESEPGRGSRFWFTVPLPCSRG